MQLQVGGGTYYFPFFSYSYSYSFFYYFQEDLSICTVPLLIRRTVSCTHVEQVINLGEIPFRPSPFGGQLIERFGWF